MPKKCYNTLFVSGLAASKGHFAPKYAILSEAANLLNVNMFLFLPVSAAFFAFPLRRNGFVFTVQRRRLCAATGLPLRRNRLAFTL